MIAAEAVDTEAQEDGFLAMLPYIRGRNEPYPPDMVGATIVRFGTFPDSGINLVIEYLPCDSGETKQITFSFSDQGMWIYSSSSLGKGNSSAKVFSENQTSQSG